MTRNQNVFGRLKSRIFQSGFLGLPQKRTVNPRKFIIELGSDIHAVLVKEYWSLQKSILQTCKPRGKLKLQSARNGIGFDSETKKLSEKIKQTQRNSDHNKV